VLHLVSPQTVLVELSKAVDDDGDGQGEYEDAGECAKAPDQFSQQSLWVEVVANSCDGHQAPPKRLYEGPCVAGVVC